MTRPDKKAALKKLTDAREALENCDVWNYEQRNEAVAEAEKDVRFASRRGWNYPIADGK